MYSYKHLHIYTPSHKYNSVLESNRIMFLQNQGEREEIDKEKLMLNKS